jgi:hypothetical protein
MGIVSTKPPNNGSGMPGLAEGWREGGLAEGNLAVHHRGWTQGRETLSQAPDQVCQALFTCVSDPRQETGAGKPQAGIYAGGVG